MKARGDQLGAGWFWEEIAGELFHREFIKALVPVEGGDDPVAIRPDFAVSIDVDAVGVRIPCRVEPVASAVFTPLGRIHQLPDKVLVGIWGWVVHEGFHGLRTRGETRDIQG